MAQKTQSSGEAPLAADLREALERSPAAKAAFERMPPSHKREHIGYIDEAKRPETRARRIEKTIERLTKTERS